MADASFLRAETIKRVKTQSAKSIAKTRCAIRLASVSRRGQFISILMGSIHWSFNSGTTQFACKPVFMIGDMGRKTDSRNLIKAARTCVRSKIKSFQEVDLTFGSRGSRYQGAGVLKECFSRSNTFTSRVAANFWGYNLTALRQSGVARLT